jgi:shikimate dehydrogenase
MTGVGGSGIPSLQALRPEALCMDCIYAPARTPFMEEAQKYGHPAGNGIGMLVYQAIFALEFFLDRSFSPETVDDLGKRLLKVSGVDPRGK